MPFQDMGLSVSGTIFVEDLSVVPFLRQSNDELIYSGGLSSGGVGCLYAYFKIYGTSLLKLLIKKLMNKQTKKKQKKTRNEQIDCIT